MSDDLSEQLIISAISPDGLTDTELSHSDVPFDQDRFVESFKRLREAGKIVQRTVKGEQRWMTDVDAARRDAAAMVQTQRVLF